MNAPRHTAHDAVIVNMLKDDPGFAGAYLSEALAQSGEPDGQAVLLLALRHIAEAQGMTAIAERAGVKRETLYRALSPKGNPTIKTLMAVLKASGLSLAVGHASAH